MKVIQTKCSSLRCGPSWFDALHISDQALSEVRGRDPRQICLSYANEASTVDFKFELGD